MKWNSIVVLCFRENSVRKGWTLAFPAPVIQVKKGWRFLKNLVPAPQVWKERLEACMSCLQYPSKVEFTYLVFAPPPPPPQVLKAWIPACPLCPASLTPVKSLNCFLSNSCCLCMERQDISLSSLGHPSTEKLNSFLSSSCSCFPSTGKLNSPL